MPGPNPKSFDDLEKLMLKGFKELLRFGIPIIRKDGPTEEDWQQGLTNKERIDCAKLRFNAMKEVAGYLKAKYKPKQADEEPELNIEELAERADTETLKAKQAAIDAQLDLTEQKQRGSVKWANSPAKKD